MKKNKVNNIQFGKWNSIRNNATGDEITGNSLLFYPNPFKDYIYALEELTRASFAEKLSKLPIVVSIYLANSCRDNCVGCFSKEKYVNNHSIKKRKSDFRRTKVDVIDELISLGIKDFKFGGGGDPLISAELSNVLELLHKNEARSVIITNGDNIRKNFEALASYVTNFRFSANANNQEIHQRINRPNSFADNYNTRIKNIRELVKERRKAGLISGTTYLVNRDVEGSVEGIEKFIYMAIDIGFDYISPRFVGLTHDFKNLIDNICEIKSKEYNEIDILLNPEVDYKPLTFDAMLFLKTTIDYEHRVRACPEGIYCKPFFYGDMDSNPFTEIWNGSLRTEFVYGHYKDPGSCDISENSCNYIFNGRMGRYNWLVDQLKRGSDFELIKKKLHI